MIQPIYIFVNSRYLNVIGGGCNNWLVIYVINTHIYIPIIQALESSINYKNREYILSQIMMLQILCHPLIPAMLYLFVPIHWKVEWCYFEITICSWYQSSGLSPPVLWSDLMVCSAIKQLTKRMSNLALKPSCDLYQIWDFLLLLMEIVHILQPLWAHYTCAS